MQQYVMKNCNFIQYADDTMIISSHDDLTEACNKLEQTIERFVSFFESHQLTIIANKTEFICFCSPSKNDFARNHTLKVKNQIVNTLTTVKYWGVYLNQNLEFQDELKNILWKIATGIKTIYAIRNIFHCDTIINTQCFSFKSPTLFCYPITYYLWKLDYNNRKTGELGK